MEWSGLRVLGRPVLIVFAYDALLCGLIGLLPMLLHVLLVSRTLVEVRRKERQRKAGEWEERR